MTSPSESYTAFLDGEMLGHTGDGEAFAVTDDSRADWCLKKLAEIEAARAQDAAFVAAERARLEAWSATREGARARFQDYLTARLQPYYDQLRDTGRLGHRRGYVLPHGRLSVRLQEATWRRDEAVLATWAEPLGLVRHKVEVNWSEIKKRILPAEGPLAEAIDTVTGEIVPGLCLLYPAREVFKATPVLDGNEVDDA